MKKLTLIIAVSVIGSTLATAADPQQIALSEVGQKLNTDYTQQLETLKEEIRKALPTVDQEKKSAFINARQVEITAAQQIVDAQKKMGEINTARALVGHAKGKWIGGADKGIATAKALLEKAKTPSELEAAQKELGKWQENRREGEQALEERQANLERVESNQPKIEKTLKEAEQTLAEAEAATLKSVNDLGLKTLLSSDQLDAKLAKYTVMLEATPQGLATFAQQGQEQKELIDKMLSADDLLIQMAVADGARNGKYGEAMQIYRDIWRASDKVAEGPLRKLALAISLEHATPIKQRNAEARTDAPEFVDPVKRYLHYEKALLNNELDPAFKNLTIWDYRMVVDGEEPDEILTWGREMLRNYRPDQVTTPDYRWRYVEAVRSDIRYGSQDNQYDKPELHFFQNILMNGGICGRRAFFGRFVLRAFGIPTTARPQTGHAALVHWTPDGWVACLGAGWGSGWTKTQYDRDLDFLATTQARSAGDSFMQVKRAQWIGDVMDEPRVFGLLSKKAPGFWFGTSLYIQKRVIAEAKIKTLAAVGEDISEANETKEKVTIAKVAITEMDRNISIDDQGTITIPAAATSNPTKSTGKIIFLESALGGKQLHYNRNGGHQPFEYTFNAPTPGKYALTARIVTPSWKQSLLLKVNGAANPVKIPLPHTVGMWDQTEPVIIDLNKGENVLHFYREGEVKGITLKDFTLTPVEGL